MNYALTLIKIHNNIIILYVATLLQSDRQRPFGYMIWQRAEHQEEVIPASLYTVYIVLRVWSRDVASTS